MYKLLKRYAKGESISATKVVEFLPDEVVECPNECCFLITSDVRKPSSDDGLIQGISISRDQYACKKR